MRRYRYVGPDDIRAFARGAPAGAAITSSAELAAWNGETATYVVTPDGVLRVASRHSEHIACAGGGDVLAAGELIVEDGAVVSATNQSTGFCPEPECWTELAAALDRAGIARPTKFLRSRWALWGNVAQLLIESMLLNFSSERAVLASARNRRNRE